MFKWLSLSALILVTDQVTKTIANSQLVYAEPVPILSSFNLTLLYNPGAAFSFLSDASGWQRWFFIVITLAAVIFLFLWLRKLKPGQTVLAAGLALVLGGALGNLTDRVLFGYVIDFIQLYYKSFYWPAFNVADSAISVGAVLLIWSSLFQQDKG